MRNAGLFALSTSAVAFSSASRRTRAAAESAPVRIAAARCSASATNCCACALARRRASIAAESTRSLASATRFSTCVCTACCTPSLSDPAVPVKEGRTLGSVTVPVTFTPTDTAAAFPRSIPARPALDASLLIAWLALDPRSDVGTASARL